MRTSFPTCCFLVWILAAQVPAWAQNDDASARDLDAAFRVDDKKAYFFKGNNVIQYDIARRRPDKGFPRRIGELWPTFPWKRIDAAADIGGGVACVFRAHEYLLFHVAKQQVVGAPKPINGNPAIPFPRVDAALAMDDGPTFIFAGNRFVMLKPEGLESLMPLRSGQNSKGTVIGWATGALRVVNPPFLGHWEEQDLDAAIEWPDGKGFFFKQDRVTRMTTIRKGDAKTTKILAEDWPGLTFGLSGLWRNAYGEDIEVKEADGRFEARMVSPSGRRRWTVSSGRIKSGAVTTTRRMGKRHVDLQPKRGDVNASRDYLQWQDNNVWRRVGFDFTGLWEDEQGRKILMEGPVRSSPNSRTFFAPFVLLDRPSTQSFHSGYASMVLRGSDVGTLRAILNVDFKRKLIRGRFDGANIIEWNVRPGAADIGSKWRRIAPTGELWRDSVSGQFIWLDADGDVLRAQMLSPQGKNEWQQATARVATGATGLSWEFAQQRGPAVLRESLPTDDARMVWPDGSFWYQTRIYGIMWDTQQGSDIIASAVISGTRGVTDKIILNDHLSGSPGRVPLKEETIGFAVVLAPDIGDFDRLILAIDRDATARRFASSPEEYERIGAQELRCAFSYVKLIHHPGIEIWDREIVFASQPGGENSDGANGSVSLESITPPRADPGVQVRVETNKARTALIGIEVVQRREKVRYLLFPDNHDPFIWYYLPEDIRLVEQTIRGEVWPDLSFIRYQTGVPADNPVRVEGGAELSFSLQIKSDQPDVVAQLRDALLARSATMRYLTARAPWAYVLDWPEAFRLSGRAWEPRLVERDPVLEMLPDFRSAFELSRGARSGLQGAKTLRSLDLLPLPVTSTKVALSVLADADRIESARSAQGNQSATSVRALRRFSSARFSADLGRAVEENSRAANVRLVESLIGGTSGIRCFARVGYQRLDTKSGYAMRIFDLDPAQVVSDWIEKLARRLEQAPSNQHSLTETEALLVKTLELEFSAAIDAGYFPDDRRENRMWARLARTAERIQPQPDSYDFETLYRNRYLRFAVYYLLWLRMDDGREIRVEGNPARRKSVANYLRMRRDEGPGFLNFLTYPKYQPVYRNLTAKQPLLGDQELAWQAPMRDRLANPEIIRLDQRFAERDDAFKAREVLREAIALFEGHRLSADPRGASQHGSATVPANPIFQPPAFVDLAETMLNLNRYDEEVIDDLFAFRPEPIRPGAIVLPDPSEDRWMGFTRIRVAPVLEFAEPDDQSLTSRIMQQFQAGSESDDESALSPMGAEVETVRGKRRVRIFYPPLTWRPQAGWSHVKNSVVKFAMPGVAPEDAEFLLNNRAFLNAQYVLRMTISHPNGDVETQQRQAIFSGTRHLPAIRQQLDVVRLNFEDLDWKRIDANAKLESVHVSLSHGHRVHTQTFAPEKKDDGRFHAPQEFTWLIGRTSKDRQSSCDVEVLFQTSGGKRVPWSGNGQPLDPGTHYLEFAPVRGCGAGF